MPARAKGIRRGSTRRRPSLRPSRGVCVPPHDATCADERLCRFRLQRSTDGITIICAVIHRESDVATTITSKGQVTIPKHIRDALRLEPGNAVDFSVNRAGEVVLRRAQLGPARKGAADRFAAVRGRAEVKWRTRDLMKLLRDEP